MINKDAVIIGGGITGCSTAYHLARLGLKNVAVVERGHLTSGATGRCGAGFRHQWSTEANCLLAKHAIARLMTLADELDFPGGLEIKLGGYLILAATADLAVQLRENVALQNRLGIDSRWVSPEEAREIAPLLNTRGIVGAAFCARDGHANPFLTTLAYARAAERLGGEIYPHTVVRDIKVAGRLKTVSTSRETFQTPVVVDAAGGEAASITAMVGAGLPVYPYRHQILVTEPLEAALTPMILSFHHHLYCQQTPHGSFIMGLGDPNEPPGLNINPGWRFLREMAQKVTSLLPALAQVHVVRQWAGLYDMSPDSQPVLDELPQVEGFYVAAGFSGHGFMIAPLTGELMAQLILGCPSTLPMDMFRLSRFAGGHLQLEASVV